MGRRKNDAPPPYLKHKHTGQAYSTLNGQRIYHGVHGSPESHEAYEGFVKRWRQREGRLQEAMAKGSLAELAKLFRAEVTTHYSKNERADIKRDLEELAERYGDLEPEEFGPKDLKEMRGRWVKAGLARQTVNKRAGRIRRLFRWGVSEGKVRPETLVALEAVEDLRKGRTSAPDYENVPPVPLRDLVRSLREMPPRVRALVLCGYYVGSRPGETCRMKAEELHRGGFVEIAGKTIRLPAGAWAFTPDHHKNLLKGKNLVYMVGPRAQEAIRPYLAGRDEGYLFQPAEAAEERRQAAKKKEKRNRRRQRPPGEYYLVSSYAHVIKKACERAGVPVWKPNQLRHNWFTRMYRIAGLAAASAAGGHARPDTTLIYVERNLKESGQLLARYG